MTTLRTAAQLCEHGYVPSQRRQAIEKVTARYAVALPSLADLSTEISDDQSRVSSFRARG
jgi:hypothetical protein